MNLNTDTKLFLGIGIITVLLIVAASIFLTRGQKAPTLEGPSVDTKLLVNEKSNTLSTPSATLTLVEFADFQCPSCASAHPLVKALVDKYKNNLNYVFRHFPLDQHKNANAASLAAEAAAEQDKFWEMQDLLFANQSEWSEEKNPNTFFSSYAKELKLDVKKFNNALEKKLYQEKVDADLKDGKSAGVNSTPTFFLNGQRMKNFGDIETIIQSELKK